MADQLSVYVENLELQLSEVEMLQSMFPDGDEFKLDDPGILLDVQDFISRKTKELPPQISLYLRVECDSIEGGQNVCGSEINILDLFCSLKHEYPNEKPDLFVRAPRDMDRDVQKELNRDLESHLLSLEQGELCIVPAIQWLKDNADIYFKKCTKELKNSHSLTQSSKNEGLFVRMWMYMHHIYSKTKRKIILDWSSDYNLTGFSLPGKPGVVCIEGNECDVEEYYSKLRRLNWKKITCRHRQVGDKNQDIDGQRIFKGFEELAFDVHGTRESHMDMGQFYHYLEKHNLGEMFTVLFGVEGK